MPVIEESVVIAREPQEVFDYVCRPENLVVWDSSIVESRQVSDGPLGKGTVSRGTSKVLGTRFEWVTEVTEYDAPRRVVFAMIEGRLKATVTNVFEEVPGGTRYTYRIDAESGLGGIFGRMADPLITSAQSRTARANLDNLAALLAP